jgi:hypothetical protein
VLVQCPGDKNGDAIIGPGEGDPDHPNAKCMHLSAPTNGLGPPSCWMRGRSSTSP